jgi:hypothetical protein
MYEKWCQGYYSFFEEFDLFEYLRSFFLKAYLFYYSVNCSFWRRTCLPSELVSSIYIL